MAWQAAIPIAAAVIGPLLSKWLENDDKTEQLSTLTSGQKRGLKDIGKKHHDLGKGGYNLADSYYNSFLQNPEQAYDQFSSPYLREFQEKILPGIAEKYAGYGALSSSGFGQALGGATSNLQSELAKLFSQLQGQAASAQYGQYNQLGSNLLNTQGFGYQHTPGGGGTGAGMLQGMDWSKISNLFNSSGQQNPQYGMSPAGNQYTQPLTGYYDQAFRSGAIT